MTDATSRNITNVDDAVLRHWPLPVPAREGDKEERGRILVIGGSREMPGAVVLAATAALRAGAGKLTVATVQSIASLVAQSIPEARVIGLEEKASGGMTEAAAASLPVEFDAVLIGPGMQDELAASAFVATLLPRLHGAKILLDACAMQTVRDPGQAHAIKPSTVLLTPHSGELAHLTGDTKESIEADASGAALRAARRWSAVVALKGATTVVANPAGQLWSHAGGNIGLAISGSGDTLAGIIAGLLARGAALEQAAVWGVGLHARAGNKLAARFGPLGYLSREISAEVPALMHSLAPSSR